MDMDHMICYILVMKWIKPISQNLLLWKNHAIFYFLALVPTNYLYPYFNSDLCFVVEIIYNVTMAECNGLGAATCLIFL